MGIIVFVYDITILPLLFDLNLGASNPQTMLPHILNSMCFLNSFCNPVVYLVRMKRMRTEMKLLMLGCLNRLKCSIH